MKMLGFNELNGLMYNLDRIEFPIPRLSFSMYRYVLFVYPFHLH